MSGRYLLLAFLVLTASGCSTSYNAVATFNQFDEVLFGEVHHDLLLGGATFTLKGENTSLRCDGVASKPHTIPNLLSCKGQRGSGEATCSDGRRIKFDWVSDSCTRAHGSGQDSMGNDFYFTSGMNEETARAFMTSELMLVSGNPELPSYRPKEERAKRGYSAGTGFFVSSNGVLVTNFHVVEDSTLITVVVDGKSYQAALIASDPVNDVAVLKVEVATTPLPLASSFTSRKGDEVLTLGYPRIDVQGQEQKATFGRVNSLTGLANDIRLAQIDVPIQPGNSGGPLLNSQGQVVGVVTSTLDSIVALIESGSLPQNVNFAVKIDYVLPAVRSFLDIGQLPVSPKMSMAEIIEVREGGVVLVIAE